MKNSPDDYIKETQDKTLIEDKDTPDHIWSPKNCTKTPELYKRSLKCNACERSVDYRCCNSLTFKICGDLKIIS